MVRAVERTGHWLLERLGRTRPRRRAQQRRDEFNKLYDFSVEGVRRALPTAKVGGPEVTGGAHAMLACSSSTRSAGTNYATGKVGTRWISITCHAKGSPRSSRIACGWAWPTSCEASTTISPS